MKGITSTLLRALLLLFFYTTSSNISYCQLYDWRGPDRTGIYDETGLLKKWPDGGPKLLWEAVNMGDGYSSATVTDDAVYITGRKESSDVLPALTLDGKIKWETIYGNAWMTNHTGSRCIPTYYNGNIFLISGSGNIVCVDSNGKIKWSKNHYNLYESKPIMFGISESPLVVDNMVIASPGGKKASMVAFNINNGNVVWEAEPLNGGPQYVNPQHGGVVLLGNNIYGANHMSRPVDTWVCVDWNTGKTLWTEKWFSRGSIISADGMLYLYEERSGHVALVRPSSTKLDIISQFQITKGEGPFWAHPVISKGKLYIRHGDVLMVYLIK